MLEELKELATTMLKVTQKIIADGTEAVPTMGIIDESGDVSIVGLPDIHDPQVRDQKRQNLMNVLKRFDAVGYVFINEIWTVQLDASNGKKPDMPKGSLKNDPRSISAMMVTGESKDGEGFIRHYYINETMPRTFDLDHPSLDIPLDEKVGGEMIGLFHGQHKLSS